MECELVASHELLIITWESKVALIREVSQHERETLVGDVTSVNECRQVIHRDGVIGEAHDSIKLRSEEGDARHGGDFTKGETGGSSVTKLGQVLGDEPVDRP